MRIGDGSSFNSARIPDREIVITIYINGDVETNRMNLYKYFRVKELCKIYYTNETRDVYIEGYTSILDTTPFSNKEVAQISIECLDPFFKEIEMLVSDLSKTSENFTFPFSINEDEEVVISTIENNKFVTITNDSESDTDLLIEVDFVASVSKLEIKKVTTGESFIVEYDFIANDKLVINCAKRTKIREINKKCS